MSSPGLRVLLVGCGKMGGALLDGIVAANITSEIVAVDPSQAGKKSNTISVASFSDIPVNFAPDVIILAVKPQVIPEVLPAYKRYDKAVLLSIAAGLTLEKLSAILGNANAAVVRSMPNLPVSVGQGMTVAVANAHVQEAQRMACDRLMASVGRVIWMQDECLIDASTALSGSGPAYVFALCEAMAAAGTAMGLSAEMAEDMARQTLIGSALLLASSTESAATLRQNVTSPKGTTEAALKYLLGEQGLSPLMLKAMQAAEERSRGVVALMVKSTQQKDADRICEAALKLTDKRPWEQISLAEIAKLAKVAPSVFSKHATSTDSVVSMIAAYVTRQSAKNLQKPSEYDGLHDALFDVFMARFEVMQSHRKAFQNLWAVSARRPRYLSLLADEVGLAIKPFITKHGIKHSRIPAKAQAAPAMLVYLAAFATWKRDETLDLSKTMAALDRYLNWSDRLRNIISCNRMKPAA